MGAFDPVNPGYLGIATIGGQNNVRFTDANITARQEINAPDMIMGDDDHNAYVYGKIEVGGTISGPVTENFASGVNSIWQWAAVRGGACKVLDEKEVVLNYYCGRQRTFTGMKVNSLNFSCAAGDICNFSVDVMGSGADAWTSGIANVTTAEKLITWDKVSVSVSGSGPGASALSSGSIPFSNFDFTIGNGLEPVYALNQDNLYPIQIVEGLRTITGSLSVFNAPAVDGVETWDDLTSAENTTNLSFTIGSATPITFRCQLHRVEPASSVGPVVSTIAFTGVANQSF